MDCDDFTYAEDDWQDDEADLRNYCPCCGHNYITATTGHDDTACAESQQ